MQKVVFDMINVERSEAGLAPLMLNTNLQSAAQAKASDMALRGYFDHTGPDGKQFYEWIAGVGYKYTHAGENLAVNIYTTSEEAIVKSWMESAGHRANILSSNYTETGIGISSGTYQGQSAVFVVQMFGYPQTQTQAQVVPTATPQVTTQASTPIPMTSAKQIAPIRRIEATTGSTVYAQAIHLPEPLVATSEYNQTIVLLVCIGLLTNLLFSRYLRLFRLLRRQKF